MLRAQAAFWLSDLSFWCCCIFQIIFNFMSSHEAKAVKLNQKLFIITAFERKAGRKKLERKKRKNFSFSIFFLKTTKVLFIIVKNYKKNSSSIRYKIKRPYSPLSIRRLGLYEITAWTMFSDVVTGDFFFSKQRIRTGYVTSASKQLHGRLQYQNCCKDFLGMIHTRRGDYDHLTIIIFH